MQDIIKTLSELGQAVRKAREMSAKTTLQIAEASGRSRDVLNRLERGQDVSAHSLLTILAAMGYALRVVPVGRPTLQQMRERFADVEEGAADLEGDAAAMRVERVPALGIAKPTAPRRNPRTKR